MHNKLQLLLSILFVQLVAQINADLPQERGMELIEKFKSQNFSTVPTLLNQEIDLTVKDDQGRTALNVLAATDLSKFKPEQRKVLAALIKKILEKKPNVNAVDQSGNSVLMVAVDNGFNEMIDALLFYEKDLNLEVRNKQGRTVFDIVLGKLKNQANNKKYGAILNELKAYGGSMLIQAIKNGNVNNINILLDQQVDLSARDENERTPLNVLAVQSNLIHQSEREQIIQKMLNSSDINSIDKNGNTPLMNAINSAAFELIVALYQKGAKTEIQNKEGKTAFNLAQEKLNTLKNIDRKKMEEVIRHLEIKQEKKAEQQSILEMIAAKIKLWWSYWRTK
ncbi:MAG: Ankyrin repeats (3 copies) [Candidatus Dependentiae bacterium ADurb.Bin331]|nr:MAG: Ankyrin repeats (3 copies) [Candidatus Dependentiae bacterium ADurb.Bin331]